MIHSPELFRGIDLILASGSPRRRELMEMAGFPFRVEPRAVNEDFPADLSPREVALYLCRLKASPFKDDMAADAVIVTADTIVVKEGVILNKAADADGAAQMLRMLSGASHQVITGVCITSVNGSSAFAETTQVYFAKLSQQEIDYYISRFKPFDKAGAYGIQEWIGAVAVEKIEGSYHNVMGLPVARLYKELKLFIGEYPPHYQ